MADTSQARVSLKWNAAEDTEGVYGYDIWRAEGTSPPQRIDAVPGAVHAYHDSNAVAGLNYRYFVQAYDFAGNRSVASSEVEVSMP